MFSYKPFPKVSVKVRVHPAPSKAIAPKLHWGEISFSINKSPIKGAKIDPILPNTQIVPTPIPLKTEGYYSLMNKLHTPNRSDETNLIIEASDNCSIFYQQYTLSLLAQPSGTSVSINPIELHIHKINPTKNMCFLFNFFKQISTKP